MSVDHNTASGWRPKSQDERNRILDIVENAAKLNASWKRTAAMLGVTERTLRRWRKDDEKGLIEMAYQSGRAQAGEEIMGLMMDRARDPDAQGSSSVLIHLSKHLCDMGDKQTNVNVDLEKPGDDAKPSAVRRYNEGLDILGLGALAIEEPESETEDDES